ncbi:hypothetical protein ACWEK5_49070 [Rhodococcus koreensis]
MADAAEWEDAFLAGLLHAMAGRDLLARRTDRQRLRTIGPDDLHSILHHATLGAAQVVTPADVRPPRTDALAVTG